MKVIKRLYVALVYIILYAPIAILILYSFNDSRTRGHFTGFSLRWYKELFSDGDILSALYNTLICALLASVIATIIGTITAIGLYKMRKGPKTLILNLSHIPMLNPEIVTGVSLMLLFVLLGLDRGFFTMLLAHITFDIPYVIVSVLPKLKQMNPHLYEAALDLGATPTQALFKVVLPEILPGIFSGFMLAVTLSLDDYIITATLSPLNFDTISTAVYKSIALTTEKSSEQVPIYRALTTIIFLITVAVVVIMNIRANKKSQESR